ncbi:MAG: LysM peptidoglycan-binding domain-containing protein, partial [Verrucomicrobia bacterium]|nr:LysM peptidoglycan-binding domain-containing protein [Verrucomicrobiota bacterium]
GPVPIGLLKSLALVGNLPRDTMIKGKSGNEWIKIEEVINPKSIENKKSQDSFYVFLAAISVAGILLLFTGGLFVHEAGKSSQKVSTNLKSTPSVKPSPTPKHSLASQTDNSHTQSTPRTPPNPRTPRTVSSDSFAKPDLAESSVQTYTVVAGDTLKKIASKFNMSIDALEKANNLTSASIIRIGQVLAVGKDPTAPPVATPTNSEPANVSQTGQKLSGSSTGYSSGTGLKGGSASSYRATPEPEYRTYVSADGNTYSVSNSDYYRLSAIRERISKEEDSLQTAQNALSILGDRIDSRRALVNSYSKKSVDDFNALVSQYDRQRSQLNLRVDKFNRDVNSFNAELERVGRRIR